MSKKRVLAISIVIITLLISACILIWMNNNSLAAGIYDKDRASSYIYGGNYQVGDQVQFDYLTVYPNLYCADVGTDFEFDKWYTCYEVKRNKSNFSSTDLIKLYIVSQQTDSSRDGINDVEQNALWIVNGQSPAASASQSVKDAAAALVNEAYEYYTNGIPDLSNFGFGNHSDMITSNADGKYGPFKITYPTDSQGNLVGEYLNIYVNAVDNSHKLSWTPKSGEEFYLSPSDGIIEGQTNTIFVDYSYGRVIDSGVIAKYSSNEGAYQPLEIIIPNTSNLSRTSMTQFKAGRIPLVVDLYKQDSDGNDLAGAIFKVSVTGGTITSGVNTSSNTFETGKGMSRIEIKPDAGQGDIDVVFSEITAPKGFLQLAEDIVLHYKWDSSVKRWIGSYDSFSQENVKIDNNNLANCYHTVIHAEDRRVIKLDFDKSLSDGTKINGAKFKVEISSGASFEFEDGAAGDEFITDGSTRSIIIEPEAGTTQFTIRFIETEAPAGFAIIEEPIEIEYTSSDGGKTWNSSIVKDANTEEEIKMSSVSGTPNEFKLAVENRRKIMIDLTKTDTAGRTISGIEFDLDVQNGELENTSSHITTDGDGKAHIEIIPKGTNDVTLTLTESENKYYFDIKNITVSFRNSNSKWEPTITDSSLSGIVDASLDAEGKTVLLNIKDDAKIEELVFEKVNKHKTSEKLSGVEFRVTLNNAQFTTIDSTYGNRVSDTQATLTTGSDGKFKINELKIDDPSKPFEITFEEISVPVANVNYRGTGKVTVRATHRDGNIDWDNKDEASASYDTLNNIISIGMENDITLDLSGRVWEDVQHGGKPAEAPNSIRDDERDNVEAESAKNLAFDVRVITSDNNTVYDSTYPKATIREDGTYEFKDLPATLDGSIKYYVEFSYDGVNYKSVLPYQGTDPARDSNAIDKDLYQKIDNSREDFDAKFETITKGKSNKVSPLEYDITTNWLQAKLITLDGNKVKKDFRMISNAENKNEFYSENTQYIDLGLVKKEVDLAAVTDIDSALVTINGKSQSYEFNTLVSMNNNIVIEDSQPIYNIYLYRSDYNYRIKDYVGLGTSTMKTLNPTEQNELQQQREKDGELDITLKYVVLINNQSPTDATVNQLAYYYDSRLDLISVTKEEDSGTIVPMNTTVAGTENKIDDANTEFNKIIIDTNEFLRMGEYEKYTLQFRVNKEKLGSLNDTASIKNWVEIISYSTTTGCVDKNSAPDNITEHRTENDTDDASPLHISLHKENRMVTGYVFDDKNENGLDDDNNSKVDDVVVQLIEVKTVNSMVLEYIWQETRTGSLEGKRLSLDGKSIEDFSAMNGKGQYTFENFIPGNYIVRFIYGDGSYVDVSNDVLSNVLEYNGQKYKSTRDAGYSLENMPTWTEYHNNYEDVYSNNISSVARDNEARRLIQTGNIIEKNITTVDRNNLDDTWMCAETSKIQVEIESPGPLYSYNYDTYTGVPMNVNLGLMERKGAELTLEKHVTSLVVQNAVNAKVADIKQYFIDNGLKVNLEDHGSINVSATGTKKEIGHKGEWIVQTDSRDYLNGKQLAITYEYLINNTGRTEYISGLLENELKEGNSYAEVYKRLGKELTDRMYALDIPYGIGMYLGPAYYTNVATVNDHAVGVDVQIEDYLPVTGTNILTYQNGNFQDMGSVNKKVITETSEADQEVKKYLSDSMNLIAGASNEKSLTAVNNSIDATTVTSFRFWSYVARVVSSSGSDVTITGIPVKYSNDDICALCTVRDEELEDILGGKENMEYAAVAETVEATVKFGGTDPEEKIQVVETTEKTNIVKTATIVLIAVTAVVAGVVVTKKFVTKS